MPRAFAKAAAIDRRSSRLVTLINKHLALIEIITTGFKSVFLKISILSFGF